MTDQFTTFLSVFNLNWHFYIKLGYYIPLSKLRFANFWFATVRYRAFQSGYFCWPLPIARKHLLRYTTVLLPDHRSQLYSQGGVVFVCICIAARVWSCMEITFKDLPCRPLSYHLYLTWSGTLMQHLPFYAFGAKNCLTRLVCKIMIEKVNKSLCY